MGGSAGFRMMIALPCRAPPTTSRALAVVEALMISHRFLVCLHAESAIGFKQCIVLRKADHVLVESPVCLDIALEIHKAMFHDQWERRLHTLAQFGQIIVRRMTDGALGNAHLNVASCIKGFP